MTKPKRMLTYFDQHNLIAQAPSNGERDGGDSLQRMGMYHFGLEVWRRIGLDVSDWHLSSPTMFDSAMDQLYDSDSGLLRRHSNYLKWYGEWNRASRDQTIPFLAATGALKKRRYVWTYIWGHLRRFGWIERAGKWKLPFKLPVWMPLLGTSNWLQNWVKLSDQLPLDQEYKKLRKLPDLTGPEFWALEIRASGAWFLYPLLWIFDLETLMSSLIWKYGRKDDNDVLNHTVIVTYSNMQMPTLWSRLARNVLDWSVMYKKLIRYFRSNNGVEDMIDLYLPIMLRLDLNGRL